MLPKAARLLRFAGSELYGGSGFREKTLRWVIATVGWPSREIGGMPWERMREREDANRTREAGDSVLVNGARGTRDIEGKAMRVGASECGQRTSFKTE
jgi:hypothetical protein